MTDPEDEPDGTEEPDRHDTEPIPRRRREPESDEDTHFIGVAPLGAAATSAATGDHGIGVTLPRFVGPEGLPEISEEETAGLGGGDDDVPISQRRVLPLEDEPSALVARYLFPTERYRGEWRKHWIYLSRHILIGVLATLVLGYLAGFLAKQAMADLSVAAIVVYALILGWVAWSVADWYYDRFILTNKRVMVVKGLVTRNVAMMPLLRVTDMKYEQTPLGRFLNYGTFVLESAGQDQALREVKYLPNPNELYLRVVEEMYEPAAVEARLGREAEEEL
jgi:membrane protein YdbS with pleckstrin-like domain